MILNSAIMVSLAATAGIPVSQELFFYMRLFMLAGYPVMIYLVISTLVRTLKEWKIVKRNKRIGEDGEE